MISICLLTDNRNGFSSKSTSSKTQNHGSRHICRLAQLAYLSQSTNTAVGVHFMRRNIMIVSKTLKGNLITVFQDDFQ